MGVVQWQENRPSRWTRAQEELSVPKASKEGSVGSLGLWGEGGGLWAGPQKALSFPTSQRWGCALVLCVPIGGLLSVSPQRWDLGQLHLPHGTPVPEMEQLQKLGSPVPRGSGSSPFPRMLWGTEMSPGTTGVPPDQGPWDDELLPNSSEFTLGLPPPLWSFPRMEDQDSEPRHVSERRRRTQAASPGPPGRPEDSPE